jgi:class 3 adenylate cyclase
VTSAVSGDLGARDRLEAAFAAEERRGLVLAFDTTNVTSGLRALTRELGAGLVASGALVAAVRREAGEEGPLAGLLARGPHLLRGRDTPIDLWTE